MNLITVIQLSEMKSEEAPKQLSLVSRCYWPNPVHTGHQFSEFLMYLMAFKEAFSIGL